MGRTVTFLPALLCTRKRWPIKVRRGVACGHEWLHGPRLGHLDWVGAGHDWAGEGLQVGRAFRIGRELGERVPHVMVEMLICRVPTTKLSHGRHCPAGRSTLYG
jgi:hypothetical protein